MADADPAGRSPKTAQRSKADAVRRLRRAQELMRRLPTRPITADEFIAEKRREAQREE